MPQSSHPPKLLPPAGSAFWKWLLAIGWSLALATGIWILWPSASGPARPSHAEIEFWHDFQQGNEEPILILSRAGRNGSAESEPRLFAHDTGMGEVFAVHALDQLFAQMDRRLQLTRGPVPNSADRDLIFLGPPAGNFPAAGQFGREFAFRAGDARDGSGNPVIVNLHPAAGEPPSYAASLTPPVTEDYAVIELAAGASPNQSLLLLAGTTSSGTQAAVDFVCNSAHVGELLPRIRKRGGGLSAFSALLRVRVDHGVPVDTVIVALRRP